MGTRKSRALPTRLEGVQRRFERWRRTRTIPSRIPEPLWAAAVKIAGTYRLSQIAKALRVNYTALKERVERQAVSAPEALEGDAADQRRPRVRGGARSVPAFLELAPPAPVGSCQCTLELEDVSGAKMRVHLQGAETPDLAALSRSFWELRS
jgi:hypothetical protein